MSREAILEKPRESQAAELMRLGCLWNTFVIVGRARTLLKLFRSQVPEAVVLTTQALANLDAGGAYDRLPPVDFSRDVLAEESNRLLVLRDRDSGWPTLEAPSRFRDTNQKRHSSRLGP